MSEIQLKATNVENKPVRIGDLPIIKTNILENAGQMDKGVVGGYNGTFPLTAASQGGIYLLPSTGKFYVCETAYNGAQISAPNSNFVELSVWKNHDRLNNLPYFASVEVKFLPGESQKTYELPFNYSAAYDIKISTCTRQVDGFRNANIFAHIIEGNKFNVVPYFIDDTTVKQALRGDVLFFYKLKK